MNNSNFSKIGQLMAQKLHIDSLKDRYLKKHAERTAGFHTLPVFQMAAAEVVRRRYDTSGLLKDAKIQKKALTSEFQEAGFDVSDNDVYKLHRVGWFGAKYGQLEDDFIEFEATEPVKGITTTGFLNFLMRKYEPKAKEFTVKLTADLEVSGSDEALALLDMLIEQRIAEAMASRDEQWIAREKATAEALFGELN